MAYLTWGLCFWCEDKLCRSAPCILLYPRGGGLRTSYINKRRNLIYLAFTLSMVLAYCRVVCCSLHTSHRMKSHNVRIQQTQVPIQQVEI